jgi:hypothetical protein
VRSSDSSWCASRDDMVHALLEKMILLDGAGGDLCQVFAYCHGESATTDPTGDQLAEHCTVSRRLVTRAITAEQANGTVGADLDSEVTAEALAAMADGIGLPAFADGVFPARRPTAGGQQAASPAAAIHPRRLAVPTPCIPGNGGGSLSRSSTDRLTEAA